MFHALPVAAQDRLEAQIAISDGLSLGLEELWNERQAGRFDSDPRDWDDGEEETLYSEALEASTRGEVLAVVEELIAGL